VAGSTPPDAALAHPLYGSSNRLDVAPKGSTL
jgi:hypothetical protein